MKRSLKRRFIFGSLRVKSLLMLFFTMLLACTLTFSIMFVILRDWAYAFSSAVAEQRVEFLTEIYHRSDISLNELAELYNIGVGPVEIFNDFEKLPPLVGVIWESELQEGVPYLSADKNSPRGVAKLGDAYLVISPQMQNAESKVAYQLVVHTLMICAVIASVCTILTINHSIRPITKLGTAIEQVGRGNFDVQVKHRGHDEIASIVENFNWMVGKLRGIEALRRDFVSGVSHEFKTPIAAISGSAKLLASTPHEKLTHERVQKYTGMILDETARMSALSSNLLQLSKVENQSAAENLVDFSLDEQLRQVILLLETQWHTKKLTLDIQLDTLICRGNEELLAQVWVNLLSNAFKFTAPGGSVIITLHRENSHAVVVISDTGIGMTPQTRARIFDKFFQGDSSHSGEGNGLGLSIVKRILDLHHAKISFESVLRMGTTCTILLPLSE